MSVDSFVDVCVEGFLKGRWTELAMCRLHLEPLKEVEDRQHATSFFWGGNQNISCMRGTIFSSPSKYLLNSCLVAAAELGAKRQTDTDSLSSQGLWEENQIRTL